MLLIFFGLAGAGKSYAGQFLAQHFPFHFLEGDTLLTPAMTECIQKRQLFSDEMINEHIAIIAAEVLRLQRDLHHENLIVAQALYLQTNRDLLLQKLPHARFVEVCSDQSLIKRRLEKRGDWVDNTYAAMIAPYFQRMEGSLVLDNSQEGEQFIMQQFPGIIESASARLAC